MSGISHTKKILVNPVNPFISGVVAHLGYPYVSLLTYYYRTLDTPLVPAVDFYHLRNLRNLRDVFRHGQVYGIYDHRTECAEGCVAVDLHPGI